MPTHLWINFDKVFVKNDNKSSDFNRWQNSLYIITSISVYKVIMYVMLNYSTYICLPIFLARHFRRNNLNVLKWSYDYYSLYMRQVMFNIWIRIDGELHLTWLFCSYFVDRLGVVGVPVRANAINSLGVSLEHSYTFHPNFQCTASAYYHAVAGNAKTRRWLTQFN